MEQQKKNNRQWMDLEKLLEEGNAIRISPQGYSMYPLLVPGRDEVVIEKTDVQKAKRGDVLLYRRKEGILVLHRVYRHRKQKFYMVGDHQTEIEGPLEESQIRGKMTGVIRKGNYFPVRHPVYVFVSRCWLLLRPFRHHIEHFIHGISLLFKKVSL